MKRPATKPINGSEAPNNKIRRIQPTKIGEIKVKEKRSSIEFDNTSQSNLTSMDTVLADSGEKADEEGADDVTQEPEAGPSTEEVKVMNEQTPELKMLIKACRKAEPSEEMKAVIKKKLLKYYHSVHPEYVTSKTFLKTLKTTTEDIIREPHLVYSKLKIIIEELDARRKIKVAAPVAAPVASDSLDVKETGDEVKDVHLKKLYKALVVLKRQILKLEEEEVDWDDDDNSSYLKKVRFEKRACDIYKKVKLILCLKIFE